MPLIHRSAEALVDFGCALAGVSGANEVRRSYIFLRLREKSSNTAGGKGTASTSTPATEN